jgi:predicted enzyme related to lactoylglutathione lyase
MKHSIVHFEIPADDVERGRAFYARLFDWKFSNPPGYDDYWMAGEEGDSYGIAMMQRQAPNQGPTTYFEVDSVEEYVARVEQLGGKVLMPKSPVPGMGWFAQCQDTEGNVFALWQTDASAS